MAAPGPRATAKAADERQSKRQGEELETEAARSFRQEQRRSGRQARVEDLGGRWNQQGAQDHVGVCQGAGPAAVDVAGDEEPSVAAHVALRSDIDIDARFKVAGRHFWYIDCFLSYAERIYRDRAKINVKGERNETGDKDRERNF